MKLKYLLLGVLIIAVFLTAGFVYQNYREKQAEEQWIAHMTDTVERSTFYEGTYLDDVALGGMTLDEAADLFKKRTDERLADLKVELTYEEESWIYTHQDIQAEIDWVDNLAELYRIARDGDLADRYDQVEDLRVKGVKKQTTLTMNMNLIRDDITAIAESLYIEPVNADISFFPEKSEKFSLTPEQDGQKVEADPLYQQAERILLSGKPGTITIEPEPVEAEVKAAHLEKATSKIASFSTDVGGSSANRIHNITLSLQKMSGTKLNPGDVFSFNGIVGPRTKKTGFRDAPVIMPDKSLQDGIGGGICQSSSTLFNAAAIAGMEIVERYHHSFPVSYLAPGLDATVSWGGADFKFKNPKDTPVFVRAYRHGSKAVVEFYGEPLPNNGKYTLTTKQTETITAPEPKRVLDTEGKYVSAAGGQYQYVKSRTGIKVNTYRVLTENGKQVSSELYVSNYYRPIQGLTYYREAPKPTETPKPSVTPTPTETPKPTETPEPSATPTPTPTPDPSPDPED